MINCQIKKIKLWNEVSRISNYVKQRKAKTNIQGVQFN
jgi:hypothetical protein